MELYHFKWPLVPEETSYLRLRPRRLLGFRLRLTYPRPSRVVPERPWNRIMAPRQVNRTLRNACNLDASLTKKLLDSPKPPNKPDKPIVKDLYPFHRAPAVATEAITQLQQQLSTLTVRIAVLPSDLASPNLLSR